MNKHKFEYSCKVETNDYFIIHHLPPVDCDLRLRWTRSKVNTNKVPNTQTTYRTYKMLMSVVGAFRFDDGTIDV